MTTVRIRTGQHQGVPDAVGLSGEHSVKPNHQVADADQRQQVEGAQNEAPALPFGASIPVAPPRIPPNAPSSPPSMPQATESLNATPDAGSPAWTGRRPVPTWPRVGCFVLLTGSRRMPGESHRSASRSFLRPGTRLWARCPGVGQSVLTGSAPPSPFGSRCR
jgi:hypothetical protein